MIDIFHNFPPTGFKKLPHTIFNRCTTLSGQSGFSNYNYDVISNAHARKGVGGKPAILVNNKLFRVENPNQSFITIPWGVECKAAKLYCKQVRLTRKIRVLSTNTENKTKKSGFFFKVHTFVVIYLRMYSLRTAVWSDSSCVCTENT